jgi:Fe-S-cluster containining protein
MEFEELFEADELTVEESSRLFNSMFDEIWRGLFPQQILIEGLSAVVPSSVITETDIPVPECEECGACCTAFVRIPLEPESTVPKNSTWSVAVEIGEIDLVVDRFIKRRKGDLGCSQLDGEVGGQVSCGIYEDRPRSCRTFEAGSDRCHAIRRAYGLEPFLSLDAMSVALERIDERNSSKQNGVAVIDSIRFVEAEGGRVRIEASMDDGTKATVHEFEPTEETWYRSQFEGRDLRDAGKIVSAFAARR